MYYRIHFPFAVMLAGLQARDSYVKMCVIIKVHTAFRKGSAPQRQLIFNIGTPVHIKIISINSRPIRLNT